MTNYKRGYALELRAKKAMEADGAFVIRSAGSHGSVDLLALWAGGYAVTMWFVQCKRDGKLPLSDAAKLRVLARIYGAMPMLAKPRKGGGVDFTEVG